MSAKEGYTFEGLAANSFTYTGATVTNAADTGMVTITFPATEAEPSVSITGTVQVGKTLTAEVTGLTELHYQWERAVQKDAVSNVTQVGSDSETYDITDADLAKYIRVTVTGNEGSVKGCTDTSVAPLPFAEFDLSAAIDAAVTAQTEAGGTNGSKAPATIVFPTGYKIDTTIDGSDTTADDKWQSIAAVVKAKLKYVILDLSACIATNNTIAGLEVYLNESSQSIPGNHFNVIYNVSRIKGIILPNTLTSIGDYAFKGCLSLASVTIPASVASIGQEAFDGCSALVSVTFGAGSNITTAWNDSDFPGTAATPTGNDLWTKYSAETRPLSGAVTFTRASVSATVWTRQ